MYGSPFLSNIRSFGTCLVALNTLFKEGHADVALANFLLHQRLRRLAFQPPKALEEQQHPEIQHLMLSRGCKNTKTLELHPAGSRHMQAVQ